MSPFLFSISFTLFEIVDLVFRIRKDLVLHRQNYSQEIRETSVFEFKFKILPGKQLIKFYNFISTHCTIYDRIRQIIEVERIRTRENTIPVRPRNFVRPHIRRNSNIINNQNQDIPVQEDYSVHRNSQEGLIIRTENLQSSEPNNLVNGDVYQSDNSVD